MFGIVFCAPRRGPVAPPSPPRGIRAPTAYPSRVGDKQRQTRRAAGGRRPARLLPSL